LTSSSSDSDEVYRFSLLMLADDLEGLRVKNVSSKVRYNDRFRLALVRRRAMSRRGSSRENSKLWQNYGTCFLPRSVSGVQQVPRESLESSACNVF